METQTLREHVAEFGTRLLRFGAAATTLRELSASIHDSHAPQALIDVLQTIDRDLMLATHDIDALLAQATREMRSVSPEADHPPED